MREINNEVVENWEKFYSLNNYYHSYVQKLAKEIIPEHASVIEFNSKRGELLSTLQNKDKVGVEFERQFIQQKIKSKKINLFHYDEIFTSLKNKKYDYTLLSHTLSTIKDVQDFIQKLKKISNKDGRIIVFYFNFLWKPVLDLAEKLGLKNPDVDQNWLSGSDIDNLFYLESFEKVKSGRRFIFPYNIPLLSNFFNKYLSALPIFNNFGLINYSIYKPISEVKDYSVTIVIPARNEEGNMKGIFKKIPKFCKKIELVFVEGNSTDNTFETIKEEIEKYKGPINAFLYKQKGKGKGDAVRLGFSKANNELFMILDADLTVDPKELPKFYNAIVEGKGELVMGSRLVYPMEKLAMRTLNIIGNQLFSVAFSFLLDQPIKDTLCGTKVLLKKYYKLIEKNRKHFGDFDPFGDYDLIFGASKLNLKITEIPIRYKERTYGKTNISRFRHGFLLLQMVLFAAKKLKFT